VPYQSYKQALLETEKELAAAIRTRDTWTIEVARLQQLARSLSLMVAKTHKLEESAELVGVQETVLSLVRAANRPVAPMEVRDQLINIGFDLTRYRQPMAVIHSALRRLLIAGFLYEPERGRFVAVPSSYRISEVPRV